MSGRQRNIRKTSVLSFDADEDDGDAEGGFGQPPAAKAAQKAKSGKKVLLSFGDDAGHEDGSGQMPKPKSSKHAGFVRAPGAVPPPPADERAQRVYTQMSGAGEYTAERLKELSKNARSVPASGKPAFKLSGSFKAAAPPKDDRFQYNVSAAGVVRPQAEDLSLQRPSNRGRGGGGGGPTNGMPLPPPAQPPPAAAAGVPPPPPPTQQAAAAAIEDDEEESAIPDEEMIAWAKAKRERLRGAHLAPDYIPTASAPAGLSMLRDKKKAEEDVTVAGSGSEGEDGEEDMRIKFMGAPPPPPSSRHGRGASAAAPPAEDGGNGEEEDEEWAQEQIRKGMGGLAAPSAPSNRPGSAEGEGGVHGGRSTAAAALAAGGSQHAAIQMAAAEVLTTLQAGLQRLQMSRKQADRNLERTSNSLQSSLAAISRMEGELEAASSKYVMVQGLKAYVADLCNMLQDKSPIVEELEDALLGLCEGRASAMERRRSAGDAEAHGPAEAAVAAAMAVLSRGGAQSAAATAAEAAAEAAEEKLLGLDLPVELDEFGRDTNAEKKAELADRAKQRRRRLQVLEQQYEQRQAGGSGGAAAAAEPRLGEDTSEESEGEVSHFRMRQGEVQEHADAVFRDADDEFGSLGAVKRRLEEWKARQPAAYRDAYVSLSAPALFAPFVRLELLKWRPLHGGETGFDSQQWYSQLFDYGMPQDPSELDPADPDANLVPQLVQKLLLPLAKQLLSGVWSPYSRQQSRAAAAMLADLLVYVPSKDEGLQELVRLVQAKLEAAVGAMALPAWPPAALAATRRAAVHLAQRFGRGVRLLAAVSAFDVSLPRSTLQRLALERLMAPHLLPYVRAVVGTPAVAADRAARIVAALPAGWFSAGAPPPRGGEGLAELLATLATALEMQAAAGGTTAADTTAARQTAGALHKFGNTARANKLGKAFGIL